MPSVCLLWSIGCVDFKQVEKKIIVPIISIFRYDLGGKKTVTKMNDSPESEVAASLMECSIYQNYTASEVLVQVCMLITNILGVYLD